NARADDSCADNDYVRSVHKKSLIPSEISILAQLPISSFWVWPRKTCGRLPPEVHVPQIY
ncbi:MAG: hypothetical protein WAK56_11545, partial [Candidatus Sulfotelmatobacter sp.]